MTTRSLPALFTPFSLSEVKSYALAKGSLARRFAQMQNYLYAQIRRTYCNFSREENGSGLLYLENLNYRYLTTLPDGKSGLLMSDFFVPQPWAGGGTMKIQGRVATSFGSGGTYISTGSAYIMCQLFKMTGQPIGTAVATAAMTGTSNHDWSLYLKIPKSGEYRCKVWLQWTPPVITGGAGAGNHASGIFFLSNEKAQLIFLSARMDPNNDDTVDGSMRNAVWTAIPDVATSDNYPLSSLLANMLAKNINSLYAYRGPEICQTYFAQRYNNTTAFVEVGRYVVYLPSRVTEIKGKLYVAVSVGGSANDSVRVLVDGIVKQTFATITGTYGTGNTNKDLDVAAITGLTDNAEHTITIEAKSNTADWGTQVNGVFFWESNTTLGLPSGTTVPANYQPLDEDGLSGDADIEGHITDIVARRDGMTALVQNDRWLAANRLRGLIGDWRHQALKRGQPLAAHVEDDRIDWTRGQETFLELGLYPGDSGRNLSIMGSVGTTLDEDTDGVGKFSTAGQWDTATGYNSISPYTWPTAMSYIFNGLRLLRVPIKQTAFADLVLQLGFIRTKLRGCRRRPATMSTDDNHQGPTAEEPSYINLGKFDVRWDTGGGPSSIGKVPVLTGETADFEHHWCQDLYELFAGSNVEATVIANLYNIPSNADPHTGVATIRPSGMLYEMDLGGAFMADEPLDATNIGSLP